jgi:hypothetical protein
MSNAAAAPANLPQRPRRWFRASSFALGMLLGMGVALAGALAAMVYFASGAAPPLAEADLQAAISRWEASGILDYRLTIQVNVTGQAPSVVELEVRNGQPTAMTRDGFEPKRHTWDIWTVEGQFEMIRLELEHAADPQTAHGVADPSQVILRGEFDPQWGYPRKFRRDVLGKSSSMQWEVTAFEPVSAGGDGRASP